MRMAGGLSIGLDLQSSFFVYLESKYSKIDTRDEELARIFFLDWLGCFLAGIDSEKSKMFFSLLSCGGIEKEKLNNPLYMGYTSHCLELDDSEFFGETHPSSVIFSSLFQKRNNNFSFGEVMKASIVAFYSLVPVGRMMNPSHYGIGWHGTGTVGSLAATIANGFLNKFNRNQLNMALSTCTTLMSGNHDVFGSDAKYLNSARAAENGCLSVAFIGEGFDSTKSFLGRDSVFFKVFNGHEPALLELDMIFDGIENLQFIKTKRFPFCHCLLPILDHLEKLAQVINLNIKINMTLLISPYSYGILSTKYPKTKEEAFFSIPYAIEKFISLDRNASVLEYFYNDSTLFEKIDLCILEDDDLKYMEHQIIIKVDSKEIYNQKRGMDRGFGVQERDFVKQKFHQLASISLGEEGARELNKYFDTVRMDVTLGEIKEKVFSLISKSKVYDV